MLLHVSEGILISIYELESESVQLHGITDKHVTSEIILAQLSTITRLVRLLNSLPLQEFTSSHTWSKRRKFTNEMPLLNFYIRNYNE